MEPKNLAIIFGPSIVRQSSETLESVVKDMKHQCRIVEALVTHVSYFHYKIGIGVKLIEICNFILRPIV